MLEKIKQIIRMPIVKAVIVALIIFIVINIIFVFESIYPIYTFYKMKYGINMPEPKEIERIYTSGSDYKVVEYFKLYYSDYEYERMINKRIFQEMDKKIVNNILKESLMMFPKYVLSENENVINDSNYYSYHDHTSLFFEDAGGANDVNLMIYDSKNKVIHVLHYSN
ncbi:unknown [Clostridium sp. CAG:762]|jgi:hypothetical protein|nr:unknown [Clostridium sp. CAG:762]